MGASHAALWRSAFRPFFLLGALYAPLLAAAGVAAWSAGVALPAHWHAHEMLFGFATAVLSGFLLTAVPNWTGRLPVSGLPLAGLFALWCAGRIALVASDYIGAVPAAIVDVLFLPALLFICAREIIAGRKWKDLKVLGVLTALTLANILFHYSVIAHGHDHMAMRLGVSAYVVLVMIIGGRIVPSFTRNWLNKAGSTKFPAPYSRFDTGAAVTGAVALAAWTFVPDNPVTALLGIVAAGLHAVRLYRWRGWATWPERLVVVLHIAYAFVPLGLLAAGLAALGLVEERSVLHLFSVGAMSCMMLAVMTRASLGHTGRALTASRLTVAAYAALILCALLRPLGEALPDHAMDIYAASGLLWIAAFGLFCLEFAPILTRKRRAPL